MNDEGYGQLVGQVNFSISGKVQMHPAHKKNEKPDRNESSVMGTPVTLVVTMMYKDGWSAGNESLTFILRIIRLKFWTRAWYVQSNRHSPDLSNKKFLSLARLDGYWRQGSPIIQETRRSRSKSYKIYHLIPFI